MFYQKYLMKWTEGFFIFMWRYVVMIESSKSSCFELFYKKIVFRNFTNFTGKHLLQESLVWCCCRGEESFGDGELWNNPERLKAVNCCCNLLHRRCLREPWMHSLEETTGGVLLKKVFLKIWQISQETPVLESFFNKVLGLDLQLY